MNATALPSTVTLSPWDRVQHRSMLAPGVFWVSTAGHGGLMVHRSIAPDVLSPAAIRHGMTWGEWICYEEDCQYAIAFFERPDWHAESCRKDCSREITDEDRTRVLEVVKYWEWEYYEQKTGEILKPGESYCKDERTFYAEHAEDWLCVSATSGTSWEPVPAGFVKVTAAKGGRNQDGTLPRPVRAFLVPEVEYCGEKPADGIRRQYPWKYSFIVDPARH